MGLDRRVLFLLKFKFGYFLILLMRSFAFINSYISLGLEVLKFKCIRSEALNSFQRKNCIFFWICASNSLG